MTTVYKAIWLSYDLGLGGDYSGLYTWLDNHNAIECGDSVAFVNYEIRQDRLKELLSILLEDIKQSVNLRAGDRLYVVYREVEGSKLRVKGNFIWGRRKSNPWKGYGDKEEQGGEDGE